MFFQPQHPTLTSHIVCYWLIQSEGIPLYTKMLPDGYSDIMLNLGAPYAVSRPGGVSETIIGSAFFGQRTQYSLLNQPGKVNMIGIRLVPGTEFLFCGFSAANLVNKTIPLSDLIGPALAKTEELLRQPTLTNTEKITTTEEILLQLLLRNNAQPNEKVTQAIQLIRKKKGNLNMDELLESLTLSYKQMERYFQKYLGLSPKLYMRIYRFHNAFMHVRSVQKANWMEVLHSCGYYDQSHFIKDFRFFSGLTPGKQFSEKSTLDEFFKLN